MVTPREHTRRELLDDALPAALSVFQHAGPHRPQPQATTRLCVQCSGAADHATPKRRFRGVCQRLPIVRLRGLHLLHWQLHLLCSWALQFNWQWNPGEVCTMSRWAGWWRRCVREDFSRTRPGDSLVAFPGALVLIVSPYHHCEYVCVATGVSAAAPRLLERLHKLRCRAVLGCRAGLLLSVSRRSVSGVWRTEQLCTVSRWSIPIIARSSRVCGMPRWQCMPTR
jgi:hypothetical protein